MSTLFDQEKLLQLLNSLYILTGFRANIFDLDGNDICLNDSRAPFCALVNDCSEGNAKCMACDARTLRSHAGSSGIHFYRCHAGICEAILPIQSNGTLLAYVSFGQFLDKTPMDEQWEQTKKTLSWYPGNMEELHRAFLAFRQYSDEEISAYADVLEALVSSIRLKGIMLTTGQTELQKLELYLDQHYMEKLSLSSISEELQIGRTKLCALAKKLSGGKTLSKLITDRRINAAKVLLLQTDTPISSIAETVGISDYNYFSKVFHSATGATPSAFRKSGRHNTALSGDSDR